MPKYRMTFKCGDCGHKFKKITDDVNLEEADCPECKKSKKNFKMFEIGDGEVSEKDLQSVPRESVGLVNLYKCKDCFANFGCAAKDDTYEDHFCSKCGSKNTAFYGTNAPNIASPESKSRIRAIDHTAEIVMQDYKMGDVNMGSNMRVGDTSAPKLPPKLQQAANSFFSPKQNKNIPFNAGQLGKAALRGAYKSNVDPVSGLQPQYKPKTEYVAGN